MIICDAGPGNDKQPAKSGIPIGTILKAGTFFKRGEKNTGALTNYAMSAHVLERLSTGGCILHTGAPLISIFAMSVCMQAGGNATLFSKRETISCITTRLLFCLCPCARRQNCSCFNLFTLGVSALLTLVFCLNTCDVLFEFMISKDYNAYKQGKQEKGRICVKGGKGSCRRCLDLT